MYKALRSAGGFKPPATLAHKGIEQNANGADREVHDFRCKLATCKGQDLHAPGKQPGSRMHVRNIIYTVDRTESGNSVESY